MITQALVLSDLHCGSTVGLLKPGFVRHSGHPCYPNAVQQWLWECWTDWQTWDRIRWDELAIIVNGDLTEGVHHRTTEVISNEPTDHRNLAFEVLAPLAERCEKIFVVEGTECHTGVMEHGIAEQLGAARDPNTGLAAWQRLDVTINGTRCIFRHHIGATSRPYLRASQLSIMVGCERQEAAEAGEILPRVWGFAHRHNYAEYHDKAGLAFVTPAWQVLTRYGHKVVSHAKCSPGVVLLDWKGIAHGGKPEVHVRDYAAQPTKGVVL